MKDWRKSPEPVSMMGSAGSSSTDQTYMLGISSESSTITSDHQSPSFVSIEQQEETQPPHNNNNSQIVQQDQTSRIRSKMDISLAEMARRVIVQKIHLFESFGEAPFPIVKSILQQCSASKLWSLEEESPEYIKHTSEIWKKHCLRDFKDIQQLYTSHPANMFKLADFTSWRELYHSKVVQKFEAMEAAKQRMKERFAALKADKEAGQVRIVAETPAVRSRNNLASVKPLGLQSTQGQKMLHKARIQANTIARSVQSPIQRGSAGSRVRLMPPAEIGQNAGSRPVASPPAKSVSTNQAHSPGSPLSPSFIGREPPGFERKATFNEADKLEREAVEQFSKALMEHSSQKRSIQDSVCTSNKLRKVMPDGEGTRLAPYTLDSSPPSRQRPGSGINVRKRQVHATTRSPSN
jgi:RNA polymerase II transcription factor SIII (Elongin) subunit A